MLNEKKLLCTACVVIATAVSSCLPPVVQKVTYTLNEKYKAVNLSDRTMVVVFPDDAHIVINNKDDVSDDYGGVNARPETRIRKFYFAEFFETFKSFATGDSVFSFDKYRPALVWDTLVNRRGITLNGGSDSIAAEYLLPEKAHLQTAGLDSAVIIVIEGVEFKRNAFHMEYYWDDKTRTPASLEVRAKVIIWDYKNDSPVFYGTVSEKTEFNLGLQRKHWDESAHNLAKKIVLAARCL
jgi:hypothetical protein